MNECYAFLFSTVKCKFESRVNFAFLFLRFHKTTIVFYEDK